MVRNVCNGLFWLPLFRFYRLFQSGELDRCCFSLFFLKLRKYLAPFKVAGVTLVNPTHVLFRLWKSHSLCSNIVCEQCDPVNPVSRMGYESPSCQTLNKHALVNSKRRRKSPVWGSKIVSLPWTRMRFILIFHRSKCHVLLARRFEHLSGHFYLLVEE